MTADLRTLIDLVVQANAGTLLESALAEVSAMDPSDYSDSDVARTLDRHGELVLSGKSIGTIGSFDVRTLGRPLLVVFDDTIPIAYLNMKSVSDLVSAYKVEVTGVRPDYRGQDIPAKLYLLALERYRCIFAGNDQTPRGRRIWDRLAEANKADMYYYDGTDITRVTAVPADIQDGELFIVKKGDDLPPNIHDLCWDVATNAKTLREAAGAASAMPDFMDHMIDAASNAGVGFHFEEGGCWGMALAIHDRLRSLGHSPEIVVTKGNTHAMVRDAGRLYDHSGEALGFSGRLRRLTPEALLALAGRCGVDADQVMADKADAAEIIEAAEELVQANVGTLTEAADIVPVLYHGTCPGNARSLCEKGWSPGAGQQGANMGQTRYLYLSTGAEDAEWFANEKGCNTVIAVRNVPKSLLRVDPEDGSSDTLDEELNMPHRFGMPGKVVLTQALLPEHFEIIQGGHQ